MGMEPGSIKDSLCAAQRVDPSPSHEDEHRTVSEPHWESMSSLFFTPIISVCY